MFVKIINAWSRNQKMITAICLVVAFLFPVISSEPYILNVGVLAVIYVILTLSLDLMTGSIGVISLGHAAFMGIGAYTASLLAINFHFNFFITLGVAGGISGFFGLLLGLPTLRLDGKYLSIVTLSFCEIMRIIEINCEKITRGPLGLTSIPAPLVYGMELKNIKMQYYLILSICVLLCVFIASLKNSSRGRAYTAIKNDKMASAAMGINVTEYQLSAFVISAVMAGVAGGFYAQYIGYINPSAFSFQVSVSILSMNILGGLGSIAGSIFGAVVLTILPEILRPLLSYREVLYGMLLVIMVIVRPKGMLGGFNLKHIKQRLDNKEGGE